MNAVRFFYKASSEKMGHVVMQVTHYNASIYS